MPSYLFCHWRIVSDSDNNKLQFFKLAAFLIIVDFLRRRIMMRPIYENANAIALFNLVVEARLDEYAVGRPLLREIRQAQSLFVKLY